MSVELKPTRARFNRKIALTRFNGGLDGTCLQLTNDRNEPYLQLTKDDALELAAALLEFATGKREEI